MVERDSDELEYAQRYAALRARGYPMSEAARKAHREMEADASNLTAARIALNAARNAGVGEEVPTRKE
jgi:hypothetical protein